MAEAAAPSTTYMSNPLIPIDLTKSPKDQILPLHNRWQPDIPSVVTVQPGAVFRVECYDWTGGQIANNDSANDIRDVELPQVHYLSGPIAVEGAEPGDIDLIKGGVSKYGMVNPIFKPGPVEPRYSEYLVFEGISVDEQGQQYYLDAHVAYRRACLNAIEYLKKFGYSGEQGYMLLSTAPCEGKLSGIVDIPNACCTLHLPME